MALGVSSTANAAGVQPDATITCNIPQPCALYKNSNGIGLSATSAKSVGLSGSTTFSATSASNRTIGVEGVDASTNKNHYNAGLFGSSPYGYGLYATSPSGIGVYANATSGVAVRAASTSGFAVSAVSGSNVAVNATSSANTAIHGSTAATSGAYAGLVGIDASTNTGANDGVLGITTNGFYGVEGRSGQNSLGGVYGSATTGSGVEGESEYGNAVYGHGPTGVYGMATSSNGEGVYGSGGGVGVGGASDSGIALQGSSNSGDGLSVTANGSGVGVRADNTNGTGADITGSAVGLIGRSDEFPLILTNASGGNAFYVTGSGDIYVHGSYHTFVHTRNGSEATAFTTRSTTSKLEDSGTAELTGGIAMVRLDPTFASAIDAQAAYQVFLTPGGDTRGLYVASKTPSGFVVRETQGGHGTLSFDYRILAAAPGHAGERMALVSAASTREPRVLPRANAHRLPNIPSAPKHRSR